ncbi:flagellin [Exiguobacterium sp. SH0S1]|uniref:flagellin N-terminal helical domain-containing protein n=1 Tax=Exiguobacterium sp. SH0S1 TaxID=2510949 RepID=UPI00103EB504|nr:flagellin [Exiguobacterium sp. SH0S1]TCI80992.1 flagellin [Exiguobacterium sp. SH0S1]
MIINNNMNAMNAHRNMSFNTSQTGKAMEKLSSGLRINRAGDDAAGLAISEKMRGQIRGLDQATRNSQDGISLIQTAEGALNETHSILQRMRELGVQGSNDTLNANDRGQVQKEMDQLVAEIDRIGNTTEFNTKKLINGGANVSGTVGTALTGVKIVGGSGDTKQGATLTITDTTVATAATATRTGAFTAGATTAAVNLKVNGVEFNFASGTSSKDVLETINKAGIGVVATATAADLTLTSNSVGSASKLTSNAAAVGTIATSTGADATITGAGTYSAQGNTITVESGNAKGLQLQISEAHATLAANHTITVASNGTLALAIGANEGQTMNIGISDMRAEALKVSDVKVTDSATAQTSVTTIQQAIDTVSSERSKLGAYQNRLEHTINNLSVGAENLQAAESRIRDVDMAKEMMNFTKNNILNQAAQAMMSQANQQPQAVLQLLR